MDDMVLVADDDPRLVLITRVDHLEDISADTHPIKRI